MKIYYFFLSLLFLKNVRLFQTAESEWSTPTNISESFVKLINYSDFEDGTGDMAPVSEDDNCDVIYTTLSGIECKQRTENSLCDVESINNDDAGPSDKCSIECNTYTLSSQSCELANCIPVLELAKLNIGTLIDDHIKLLREKANSVQLNKNERVKQLKLAAVRRIIERRNCIQRMREEITSQMNRFHELLDELEKI